MYIKIYLYLYTYMIICGNVIFLTRGGGRVADERDVCQEDRAPPCACPAGLLGKRNGSRTCRLQTVGRAGTNLGLDGLK